MISFTEERAFPSSILQSVHATTSLLAHNQTVEPRGMFVVNINDETLQIPVRVYYRRREILIASSKDDDLGLIAACLGTRHADGHVREACLQRLLPVRKPWAVPFILHLLGEYVREIVQQIDLHFRHADLNMYPPYLRQNPAHFRSIERRAVSYWDVYHRHWCPRWNEYTAHHALQALRLASERAGHYLESTTAPRLQRR